MELGSLMGAVIGEKIFCPKCGQGFKEGDVVEFVVSNVIENGAILTVDPVHKRCPAIVNLSSCFGLTRS